MKTKLILAALGSMSLSTATLAQSAYEPQSSETVTMVVPYGDLDLTRRAGAEAMVGRIRAAATFVCGGSPDPRDMNAARHFRACAAAATEGALNELRLAVGSRFYLAQDASAPRTVVVTRR